MYLVKNAPVMFGRPTSKMVSTVYTTWCPFGQVTALCLLWSWLERLFSFVIGDEFSGRNVANVREDFLIEPVELILCF